jgi:hypothetical protein
MLTMMKVLKISTHLLLHFFCENACDFSARDHVFSVENCMGQQDINGKFYDSYFQPSNCEQ